MAGMPPKQLLLYGLRALGVFALARWLSRGRAQILCYHGGCLGDEDRFNSKLFCRPELLEQRLRWLRAKGFRPVRLDQVLDGSHGPGAVAVTLDDGWYSSATQLIPLLHRLGFPCSLYLATENFEAQRQIYSVALGYLLWKAPRRVLNLQGLAPGLDGTYRLAEHDERGRLREAGIAWLQTLKGDPPELEQNLLRLAQALGVDKATLDLPSRRFVYMSREQLLGLPALDCSVEAHGHRHRYPKGDPVAFAADLQGCLTRIQALGLPMPQHYCYPSSNFDAQAATVLRAAGLRSATTCLPDLPPGLAEADRAYYLPRFLDGASVSQIEFEAELSGVMRWLRRPGTPRTRSERATVPGA